MLKHWWLSAGLAMVVAAGVACGDDKSDTSSTSTTAGSGSVTERTATVVKTEVPATTAATGTAGATGAATPARPTGTAVAAATTAPAAPAGTAAAVTKFNLNTATREQFLTVPNVGDRFVREFMEYRPYVTIAQFRRELGKYVNAAQVAEWEKYVFVPVDPNKADVDTLRQLPGVDAAIAGQLVTARPYASQDAFITKLAQLIPADQAVVARAYLGSVS